MIVNSSRKNKVCLEDYDFRSDIEKRLLMAEFSVFDIDVLDEIINNSLQMEISQLAEEVDADAEELVPTLKKLSHGGLLTVEGRTITVDKEARKYYDSQVSKFDDRFMANMDYLQSLLAKVPIQILPNWYAIPRTSDNIFESILEKYLATTKIYQRYLSELQIEDPILEGIINDVFQSETFEVSADSLKEKYSLSPEAFEECLLHLEFNFICCVRYKRAGDHWKQVVAPFYEWRHYLLHLRNTETPSLGSPDDLSYAFDEDFPFVNDMAAVLQRIQRGPLASAPETFVDIREEWRMSDKERSQHLNEVVGKLVTLGLAARNKGEISATDLAAEWLELSVKDRALYLYRQPNNCLALEKRGLPLANLRNIREAEKSIGRVVDHGWVLFEDFVGGVLQSFDDEEALQLVKRGRKWQYSLPEHGEDERQLIYFTIFERLFQVGMVNIGEYNGKPCFIVTSFGRESLSL